MTIPPHHSIYQGLWGNQCNAPCCTCGCPYPKPPPPTALTLTPLKHGIPLPTNPWYLYSDPGASKQGLLPAYTPAFDVFQAHLPPITGANVFPQPYLPPYSTGANVFKRTDLPAECAYDPHTSSETSSDSSESLQFHVSRQRPNSMAVKKRSTPNLKAANSRRVRKRASVVVLRAPVSIPVSPVVTLGQSLDPLVVVGRPDSWRRDYKPPSRARTLSRKLTQCINNAIGPGRCDYKLTPLLEYVAPENHPIGYDIRLDPFENDVQFLNLFRASSAMDYFQPATVPPQREMCFWHPRLPWYIHVRRNDGDGITIQDVLCQIYQHLSTRLRRKDIYNDVLDWRTRESLLTAYTHRCGSDAESLNGGLLRMDFLEFDVLFLGLKKSRNGMWEIKTLEAER